MAKKKNFFERSTQHILDQVDKMGLDLKQSDLVKHFVMLFRSSFKLPEVKQAVFFPKVGNDYKLFPYDSFGYCKSTSSLHFLLMGDQDWQLMYIDYSWKFGPHYFLLHKKSKEVLDYTYDQYAFEGKITIPYETARPAKIDQDVRNTAKRFMWSMGFKPEELGLDSTNVIGTKENHQRSKMAHRSKFQR